MKTKEDMLKGLVFKPFSFDYSSATDADFKRKEETLRPGAVVRTGDGEVYIVGDTNCNGGACDCCAEWRPPDIVEVAYLWKEK